ncbi:phage tail tape measure protein [Chromobacterium subtsugae]|uniref:phage tail tape measure protein n=1 Tax=Chromobacterium subtsugae TaxID=251747 RepID=UPI000640DAAC|nr:phage tail tape measure protein [Chromobacterium subtsugae]
MTQNFLISLLLRARDEASAPTARALQNLKREATDATAATSRVAAAAAKIAEVRARESAAAEGAIQRQVAQTAAAYQVEAKAAQDSAAAATRANDTALTKRLRDYGRYMQAYEALGVRSETEIQREIARTQAAYQRLARSGRMSADEQRRAYQQMRDTIADLNREMGRMTRMQRVIQTAQRGAGGARHIGEGILGVGGAMHAVSEPLKETMGFDRRVAMMANTAYNEKSVPERMAGQAEIRGAIRNTINMYGGNLERVTETLDQLLSHNSMPHDQVFRLLPILQKYATAEGADPNDLGNVVFKGVQNFGFKEHEVPQIMEMAIRGSHMGGFKLPDMAKWLPQQMAAGRNSGLSGVSGMSSLIALNELSYTTAGTVDEAGNNALDLLTHLNSRDTARSVKKYLHRDLSVAIANGRAHGKDSIEVFGDLLSQLANKDKNYIKLKKQFDGAKDDDSRKQVLGNMVDVVQGSAIGKIVHNRQEMMALMAYINQPEKYRHIKQESAKAQGYGDKDFETIQNTADYKTERTKSIADMGEKDALRGLSGAVGDAADKVAEYAALHPRLTAAVMGAKVAFETIVSAVIAIGLGRMVFGGGKPPAGPAPGGAAPGAGAAAGEATGAAGSAGAAATGGAARAVATVFSRLAGVGSIATSIANFTTTDEDAEIAGPGTVEQNIKAKWDALNKRYPKRLIDAARAEFQPWYQFGDGLAVENERWVQQYQKAHPDLPATPTPVFSPQLMAAMAQAQQLQLQGQKETQTLQPINITIPVHLDSRPIAEEVTRINVQQSLRH